MHNCHPSGLWACVWDGGHQQHPWGQGQRHSQGQISFNKHMFEHTWFPIMLSRQSGNFLLKSGPGCTTVDKESVFKDFKWLLVHLGHCGSVCSQRGTLSSSSCRAAQDRGRLGFQYHGWKGAELPYIHLTDHPRRNRWSTRRPEERRPASLC